MTSSSSTRSSCVLGLCVRYKTDKTEKATGNLIDRYKRRESADAALVSFILLL